MFRSVRKGECSCALDGDLFLKFPHNLKIEIGNKHRVNFVSVDEFLNGCELFFDILVQLALQPYLLCECFGKWEGPCGFDGIFLLCPFHVQLLYQCVKMVVNLFSKV